MKKYQAKYKFFALFLAVVLIIAATIALLGDNLVLPAYAKDAVDVTASNTDVAESPDGVNAEDPLDKTEADIEADVDPTEDVESPTEEPPVEENETSVSEAEVDIFLVRFYDEDDTLLHEVPCAEGSPVEKPDQDPQQEGLVFSHWYFVDDNLEGDALLPYDFDQAIVGITYLKAYYLPQQQESQTPEDPEETDQFQNANGVETDTPAVRVHVNILPGQTINYGDEVVFTAEIEECGKSPRIQWQYSPDNITWTDIAGGTNAELAVLITPSNAAGYWRVVVTITD